MSTRNNLGSVPSLSKAFLCCLKLGLCFYPLKGPAVCPGHATQLFGLHSYESKSLLFYLLVGKRKV